ncbi:MAG: hypothetical protein D6741_15380, partial [Planctomycetota bacterium]
MTELTKQVTTRSWRRFGQWILALLALNAIAAACHNTTNSTPGGNAGQTDEITGDGVVARVEGRQDIYVEVTMPSSPIFGAAVQIPSSSFPDDFQSGMVRIDPATDIVLSNETTAYTAVGNTFDVRFLSQAGGEPVKLAGPVKIFAPYMPASVTEPSLLHVAHRTPSGDWQLLTDGRDTDLERGRVIGKTTDLSPFVAVLNLPVTTEPSSAATDTSPPETFIETGPSGTVTTTATFTFSATDNTAVDHFECRIDSGAWAVCTSPVSYSSLTDGN